MAEYADKSTQEALIRAVNLLGAHVADSLPVGWEIVLSMTKSESTMSLIDPDGEEVEVEHDHGISMVDAMIEAAREVERERREPDEPTELLESEDSEGIIRWRAAMKRIREAAGVKDEALVYEVLEAAADELERYGSLDPVEPGEA